MICPDCQGMGRLADPTVMNLIVQNLATGGDKDDEIQALKKKSGKTGMYWMVGTCPTCKGTGEVE